MIKNYSLLFAVVIMFFIGCQKEDPIGSGEEEQMNEEVMEETPSVIPFNVRMNLSNTTYPSFVTITKEGGEVIVDSVANGLIHDFVFEIDVDDKINVTAGYVSEDQMWIYTYLDVDDDSEIDLHAAWEQDACLKSIEIPVGIPAKLRVTDVDGNYRIVSSVISHNTPEFSDNEIEIDGYLIGDQDIQIMIQEAVDSIPKTMIIRNEDWERFPDYTAEHVVSFNDFTQAQVRTIDLGIDNVWGVLATGCDKSGRVVGLDRFSSYMQYQKGTQLEIFLTEGLDLEKIKLNFFSALQSTKFEYSWIHNDLPQKIEVPYDLEAKFLVSEPNHFWIERTYDYNINVAEYLYSRNNFSSRWRIVSDGGEGVGVKLPDLPNEMIEQFPFLSELLGNPLRLYNYMIRTEYPVEKITDFNISYLSFWDTPDLNYYYKITEIDF